MFRRDTFRLIRHTLNRFISLFFIALIGVGFMAGLLCTPAILRKSVDIYYDRNDVMDIQLYSSYGFCYEDLDYLNSCDFIVRAEGSKFEDVYCGDEEISLVTRFQEMDVEVNRYELIDGRMPMKANEALALGASNFSAQFDIGKTVHIKSDVSETLRNSDYVIV
ncbi:MAG: hypothetical protein II712_04225, partial [Erysipelotrichaceae bacterium]|nr:hypothetical protein [Erysipelotrichaceae bacterium]